MDEETQVETGVKTALTLDRPPAGRRGTAPSERRSRRRPPTKLVENDSFSVMLGRLHKAFGRRVGEGDTDDLALMGQVRDGLDAAIAEAVAGLRAQGFSWAEIARPLGTTRQAAQQRWGKS